MLGAKTISGCTLTKRLQQKNAVLNTNELDQEKPKGSYMF